MNQHPKPRHDHWEAVYQTKPADQVSWYEPVPTTSLQFIEEAHLPLSARIIDVGGGDSRLVDCLLARGYQHITVLDISEKALQRARQRLGDLASGVTWVVADATQFQPTTRYDFWHDRAAFHFLTNPQEVTAYLAVIGKNLTPAGVLVVGTFAEDGPDQCSGLPVKQYSKRQLTKTLAGAFRKLKCLRVEHPTPFGTRQPFTFCSFQLRTRQPV